MIQHRSPISGIATSAGKYIATAGYDNTVILWDHELRRALALVNHDHLANQCKFSPDGKFLVSSSSDYSARLWSVPDMRLISVLGGHDDDVESIAFHPQKQQIATCSRDNKVRVFDFDGQLLTTMSGHSADVISIDWNHDGTECVSSSDDGTIRRWDGKTGNELELIDMGGVETDAIALLEDGFIVAGDDNGELTLVKGGQKTTYAAHSAGIKRVVYDPDHARLVSLSYDRSARFWHFDGKGLIELGEAALPPVVWPRACAWFDENQIVFVTFGSSYATYNIEKKVWDTELVDPTGGVNGLCNWENSTYTVGDSGQVRKNGEIQKNLDSLCNFITPYNNGLIAGGQSGAIFDALDGSVIHQHRSPFNCAIVFENNGRDTAVVGSYTGDVVVLTAENGRAQYHKTVMLHDNAIKGMAVSDGKIFSVCATGAAALHNAEDLSLIARFEDGHDKIANDCAALIDGRFASVSRDLKLRIWDSEDVKSFKTPHLNSIKCCAACDKGMYIATCDYAGFMGIFNVANGEYVKFERLSNAGLSSVIYDPSLEAFLIGSYSGQVYSVVVPSESVVYAS
jgi:WD40 repeat protein